jgi:Flp pilus assembly pilin Flp
MVQHHGVSDGRRLALIPTIAAVVLASVSGLALGRRGSSRGDRGATAAEYALMAGLIAVVIVVSVTLFGRNVSALFLVPSSVFNP